MLFLVGIFYPLFLFDELLFLFFFYFSFIGLERFDYGRRVKENLANLKLPPPRRSALQRLVLEEAILVQPMLIDH